MQTMTVISSQKLFVEPTKWLKKWILDPDGYKEVLNEEGEIVYKYKSFIDYFNKVNIDDRTGKKVIREIPQKRIVFWSKDYAVKTKIERDRVIAKQKENLKQESTYKNSKYGYGSKYIQEEIKDKMVRYWMLKKTVLLTFQKWQ